jgi:hypothetical protein
MSGKLTIAFASNMPSASVEVVSPDLEVVKHLMLTPGRKKSIQVPSENSFLRVHLPSGQVVTLRDPGKLKRMVSMQSILNQTSRGRNQLNVTLGFASSQTTIKDLPQEEAGQNLRSLTEIDHYHTLRARTPLAMLESEKRRYELPIGKAKILWENQKLYPDILLGGGREAHWSRPGLFARDSHPKLQINPLGGIKVEIRIPPSTNHVWARVDELEGQETLVYSVRVATREPIADAIMNYLQRGDLYSAESMGEWIPSAETMLEKKMNDPHAAAVGAYLLLRLKQFDRLHNWAKNLANWFEFLPDGCVIWAWQRIFQAPRERDQIEKYLFKAASRGLPFYTEGLRLLIDGLEMIEKVPKSTTALNKVRKQSGVVLWNSPLTTSVFREKRNSPDNDSRSSIYNIAFAAPA